MNTQKFMAIALRLGERNIGQTWPNPSVGCVITQEDSIVGMGVTAVGGRPHAEAIALEKAGFSAKGATAYVTLEPCAHGCAPLLIQAGIAKVVIAIEDPDPRTAGKGISLLKKAGITVTLGQGEKQAMETHRGFFSRITRGRPVVDVKMAISLDGKMALSNGHSQWITGEMSRNFVQVLRSRYDAILTACKTVAQDNAQMTCRLSGYQGRQPVRIIIGNAARLHPDLPFFQSGGPVWIMTYYEVPEVMVSLFQKIIRLNPEENLENAIKKLGDLGLTRMMVEGGSSLVTNLFVENLIDRWHLFYAPIMLGGGAMPLVGKLPIRHLQQYRLAVLQGRSFGDDFYIEAAMIGHTMIPQTQTA